MTYRFQAGCDMSIRVDDKMLGSHLREARKRMRMTQAAAAECIGVSSGYYASLERGRVRINLERLFAACLAFRVAPASILDRCCEELLMIDPDVMDASADKQKMKLLIEKSTPSILRLMLAVCESLYNEYSKE